MILQLKHKLTRDQMFSYRVTNSNPFQPKRNIRKCYFHFEVKVKDIEDGTLKDATMNFVLNDVDTDISIYIGDRFVHFSVCNWADLMTHLPTFFQMTHEDLHEFSKFHRSRLLKTYVFYADPVDKPDVFDPSFWESV